MVDSNTVAALMAQQAQSQQIMQQQGRMGMVPSMGQSAYPPQFSYGQDPFHASIGNKAGSMGIGAMAAIPGAMGAASMVGGVAQLLGSKSALAVGSQYLDPFGWAFKGGSSAWGSSAGAGMATRVGATALGATAAFLPAYAAFKAGEYAIGQAAQGWQDQQQVSRVLAQNMGGFANTSAHGGRGFSSMQSYQIGSTLRGLDTKNPLLNMKEATSMLSDFSESGQFQGINDVEVFTKKLKGLVETTTKMARTLGTTYKEATQIISGMRSGGFYTPTDILGNTVALNTAKSIGASTEGFMGTQASGAGIARAFGMEGKMGAKGAGGIMSMFMLSAGNDPAQAQRLMDMTGTGTLEEASSALGSQFTGGLAKFFSQGAGQGLLAAAGKQDSSGNYTGEVDWGGVDTAKSGGLKKLSSLARGRLHTSGTTQGSFVAKKEDIAAQLLGPEGLSAVVELIRNTGHNKNLRDEDFEDVVGRELFEGDRKKTKELFETIKDYESKKQQMIDKTAQSLAASRMAAGVKMHSFAGLKRQVLESMNDSIGGGIRDWGARTGSEISESIDTDIDTFFGVSRSGVSGDVYKEEISKLVAGKTSSMGGAVRAIDFHGAAGALAAEQGVGAAQREVGAARRGESINLGSSDRATAAIEKLKANPAFEELVQGYLGARRRGESVEEHMLKAGLEVDRALGPQQQNQNPGSQQLDRARVAAAFSQSTARTLLELNAGGEAVGLAESIEADKRILGGTRSSWGVKLGAASVVAIPTVGLGAAAGIISAFGNDAVDDTDLAEGKVGRGLMSKLEGKSDDDIKKAFKLYNEMGDTEEGKIAFLNALGVDPKKYSKEDINSLEKTFRATGGGETFQEKVAAAMRLEGGQAASAIVVATQKTLQGKTGLREGSDLAAAFGKIRTASVGKDGERVALNAAFGRGGAYSEFISKWKGASADDTAGVSAEYRDMFERHSGGMEKVRSRSGGMSLKELNRTLGMGEDTTEAEKAAKYLGFGTTGTLSKEQTIALAEQLQGQQAVGQMGADATAGVTFKSTGNADLDIAQQIGINTKLLKETSEQVALIASTLPTKEITAADPKTPTEEKPGTGIGGGGN